MMIKNTVTFSSKFRHYRKASRQHPFGIVPRYARVTLEGYDTEGNKIKIRAREELAIAFQHEIDHLNGIIFIDHIDPKNPFKDKENMRAI